MGDPHGTEEGKAKRFECQHSGHCCSVRDRGAVFVYLTQRDIETLSAFLELSPKEFNEKHCATTDSILHLSDPQRDCQFLEHNRCAVYDARPLLCRTWPFWPKNMVDDETWKRETRGCEGVGKGRLHSADEIAAIGVAIESTAPVMVVQPAGEYVVGFVIEDVRTLKLDECPQCKRQFNSPHPKMIEMAEKALQRGGDLPPIQCPGCGSKLTPEGRLVQVAQVIQ